MRATINLNSNPRPHETEIIEHGHGALCLVRCLHFDQPAKLAVAIDRVRGDYAAFLDSAGCL